MRREEVNSVWLGIGWKIWFEAWFSPSKMQGPVDCPQFTSALSCESFWSLDFFELIGARKIEKLPKRLQRKPKKRQKTTRRFAKG